MSWCKRSRCIDGSYGDRIHLVYIFICIYSSSYPSFCPYTRWILSIRRTRTSLSQCMPSHSPLRQCSPKAFLWELCFSHVTIDHLPTISRIQRAPYVKCLCMSRTNLGKYGRLAALGSRCSTLLHSTDNWVREWWGLGPHQASGISAYRLFISFIYSIVILASGVCLTCEFPSFIYFVLNFLPFPRNLSPQMSSHPAMVFSQSSSQIFSLCIFDPYSLWNLADRLISAYN